MKDKEALEKLDHTLCLNSLSLRFGVDTDYHIDCKDADEMVDCIETLQEALKQKEKQDKILEIINKYESLTFVKENGRYKIILASEKIEEKEHNALWGWLNNEKENKGDD